MTIRPLPITLSPAHIPALRSADVRTLIAIALALLLAACAAPAPLKPDYERDSVRLHARVYPHDDGGQLRRTCASFMTLPELNVGGCARHSRIHDSCEIFITKPRHLDDHMAFAAIGHEVWHCLRGSFHDYPAR